MSGQHPPWVREGEGGNCGCGKATWVWGAFLPAGRGQGAGGSQAPQGLAEGREHPLGAWALREKRETAGDSGAVWGQEAADSSLQVLPQALTQGQTGALSG